MLNLNYADVHWFQTLTLEGQYKSADNLRVTSFANPLSDLYGPTDPQKPTTTGLVLPMTRGWETSQMVAEGAKLSPQRQKDAVAQRREQVAIWRASDDAKLNALAITAEHVWGLVTSTGKDAKNPPLPTYAGNMGFRRAFAIMGAIHVLNYEAETPNYEYVLPFVEAEYANEIERIQAHIFENEGKQIGVSRLQPLDHLLAARKLVGSCGIEANLTTSGVARGTAQKVWAYAKLDSRFGNLKMYDRAMYEEPTMRTNQKRHTYKEGGYVPLSVLDTSGLRELNAGSKKKGIEKADSPEEVESFIAAQMRGAGGNAKKTMQRANIEAAAESHDALIVRMVCTAILKDDKRIFEKLRDVAEDINTALEGIL